MSLKRTFDFRITSGHGCIHRSNHAVYIAVDGRPLRIAEYNDGDSPAFQVLLVLDIFVRGKQKVEPRFLGWRQQFTVRQGIPASCYGFYNRVTEKPTEILRGVPWSKRMSIGGSRMHRTGYSWVQALGCEL